MGPLSPKESLLPVVLVVVDYYRRYVEEEFMQSITTEKVVNALVTIPWDMETHYHLNQIKDPNFSQRIV